MAFDPKPHLITLPRRVKDPETGQWTTRLSLYLEVKYRVVMFRERYPHGAIDTEEPAATWSAAMRATRPRSRTARAAGPPATAPRRRPTSPTMPSGPRPAPSGAPWRSWGSAPRSLARTSPRATTWPMRRWPHPMSHPPAGQIECSGLPEDPAAEASRLTTDQARRLKQLAQQAFGYREGERRLRQDLGFEVDEKLTLRHLAAHISVVQAQPLIAAYEAALLVVGRAGAGRWRHPRRCAPGAHHQRGGLAMEPILLLIYWPGKVDICGGRRRATCPASCGAMAEGLEGGGVRGPGNHLAGAPGHHGASALAASRRARLVARGSLWYCATCRRCRHWMTRLD